MNALTAEVRQSKKASAPWPMVTVGDVFELQQGKALSASARTASDRHPFLRTTNVLWNRIDVSAVDTMGMTTQDRSRHALAPGDLLICEGGEIGRAAVWHGEIAECSYQNHIHRLRARNEADPEFFAYWFRYAFTMTNLYQGAGTRTTIPNLSGGRLLALPIPLPPIDEQRRISRILSAIQRAADARNGVLSATLGLKLTVENETLGKLRAPRLRLGDLLVQRQYGMSVRGNSSGKWPLLRMTNIANGSVNFDKLQFVDVSDAVAGPYTVADGDILFNRTNSPALVGRTGLVRNPPVAVFASYLIRLRPDPTRLAPQYLNRYLNWEPVQQQIRAMAARGVSQANVSASKLAELELPVPPIDQQLGIAAAIESVQAKASAEFLTAHRTEHCFRSVIDRLLGGTV